MESGANLATPTGIQLVPVKPELSGTGLVERAECCEGLGQLFMSFVVRVRDLELRWYAVMKDLECME